MKKNLLLSVVCTLWCYVCQAVPYFFAPDGCITYDAQTNKLTLKVDYGSSNWTHHVGGQDTWIYIKISSSASIYNGPFASTSCDPGTYSCEYDLSSLIGLIAVPGCYEFFAVSSHSHSSGVPLPAGATPPLNPNVSDVFPYLSPSVWNTRPPVSGEPWDVSYDIGTGQQYGDDACTCPDTDTLDLVKCNSDFRLVINHLVSDGTSIIPQHVEAQLLEYHSSSTYSYDWGDGTITSVPHSHVYSPGGFSSGTYVICVTETTISGCVCTSCVRFTLPLTTLLDNPCDDTEVDPVPSSLEKPEPARGEVIFDRKLEIYPNPAANQVEIKFEITGDEDTHVNILDTAGKLVYESGRLSKGIRKLNVSTEQLQSGVYYVKLKTGNGESVEKMHILK